MLLLAPSLFCWQLALISSLLPCFNLTTYLWSWVHRFHCSINMGTQVYRPSTMSTSDKPSRLSSGYGLQQRSPCANVILTLFTFFLLTCCCPFFCCFPAFVTVKNIVGRAPVDTDMSCLRAPPLHINPLHPSEPIITHRMHVWTSLTHSSIHVNFPTFCHVMIGGR